jgi:DNA-binding NtrC family response regulator/tetratricopeptide (TPR) repeat protein
MKRRGTAHSLAGRMTDESTLLDPLLEVMTEAREGAPRWVTVRAQPVALTSVMRRASRDAEARGFVPLTVDAYLRLADRGLDELEDRTLLLIAGPATSGACARTALMQAASRSPRPHVLLALQAGPALPAMVREARTAYSGRAAPVPEEVRRHVERTGKARDLAQAGCHAAAERLLRDAGGALVRRYAWAPAAAASVLLGRLLLERGRAAGAIDAFGDAARHADRGEDEAAAVDARIWQAAARTDAGQLVAAEAQCRAVLATVPGGVLRLRAAAALTRVLLWQGRPGEASDLTAGASESGEVSDPYVSATGVRLLLELGRPFEAGRAARELMTRAAGADPMARVIALGAHFRVLLTIGDFDIAADLLERLRGLTRAAHTPLRLARARLLMADAYRRSGQTKDLARELSRLSRLRGAAPPLLRTAIVDALRGTRPSPQLSVTMSGSAGVASAAASTAASAAAPRLVAIAREEEEDEAAVRRLLEAAIGELRCTRVDVHSADAGPASTVASSGPGRPTRLGTRVLEAGIAIGPEAVDAGIELALPVRLGSRLLASLGARWPVDRPAPPHARALLELTAAVAAPRIDSLLAGRREAAAASIAVPELVGASAGMTELRQAITKAAAAPFAVLIEGESGVGKELVARALHQLGPRRERPLCDVNCAAFADDLLEAELFGHARGAFTGAVADRPGLFEAADGGTVFLDEVADLSARAQAKLLRVIQQQEVRRVGETFSRPIDVRFVTAANRDMRAEAAEGRFRHDLLYRLDVIRIVVPPLRERPDDIAPLALHFWASAAARVASAAELTHGVLAALARYHWPGNVRELQNVVAAIAVAAPSRGAVRPHLLPAAIAGAAAGRSARLIDARAQFDRRFVQAALARAGGSRTRAARELGVSRQGLLKILHRLGTP